MAGELCRNIGGESGRRARDMAVHPLERRCGRERQPAAEELVQRHADRVEVAADIDLTVHAAGLLRRHVRERSLDLFGRTRAEPRAGCSQRCRTR